MDLTWRERIANWRDSDVRHQRTILWADGGVEYGGAVVWRARNLAYHREQTVNNSGFGSLGLSFPGQYLDAESGMADNWHACTTRAVGGIRKAIRLGSKVD